ncbi:MAG: tRNA uridine-5-carboxymethylaminomethyl(34) synthesis GTPase MnmE [Pseudomonadota bacterium]
MHKDSDTIYALSTAPGRAAIAIVRLSGPAVASVIQELLVQDLPQAKKASLKKIYDPSDGEVVDVALVLWNPGPGSFTGQDMAEFHLHGGRAVVDRVLSILDAHPSLRTAEAGEFTRRAFDNGKLDLSEVEGLADLIDAETEAQRRLAVRQMGGALSKQTETWRELLLRTLAHIEAWIDFPDEDLPAGLWTEIMDQIDTLSSEIASFLEKGAGLERVRSGIKVAIIGPPNAGKSSLLNAMAQRDVAIVSDAAGTTRDVVEVHLDLAGYAVTLADTAGIRSKDEQQDPSFSMIEQEGIRRARDQAAMADLVLVLCDASHAEIPRQISGLGGLDRRCIVVLNKSDLLAPGRALMDEGLDERVMDSALGRFFVSAKTGEGLSVLLSNLQEIIIDRFAVSNSAPALTRARHRQALCDCVDALSRARQAGAPELMAEDLRLAQRALGRITGQNDVEDLLDIIFRDFCIGK